MKRTAVHLLLLLLVVGVVPAAQKFGISLAGGYCMPQADSYQKGPGYGLGLSYNLFKNLGIELALLYNQSDVAQGEGSPGKGKLTRMLLQFNLVGRIPLGKKMKGLVIAGAHYSRNDYELDEEVRKGLEPFGFIVEGSMESGIGYQAGAGLEFFVGKRIALQVDGRYFKNDGKGKWKITDEVSGLTTEGDLADVKLDFVLVQVSIRFFL